MKLFVHELRTEQLLFWRNREAAFFTFLLPIIFFLVFGSIYGNDRISGIRGAAYLEAGMIGYGVASTAFAGLAITMVIRRESGVPQAHPRDTAAARDLRGRRARLDVRHVPDRGGADHRARAGALLGRPPRPAAAHSSPRSRSAPVRSRRSGSGSPPLVRSAEGSSAVVNFVYLPMAIISGTFFSPAKYPGFLRAIADVLPLTYFTKLTRDVMMRHHHIWSDTGSLGVVAALGRNRRSRCDPRLSLAAARALT